MDLIERIARGIDASRNPNDSVYDYARAALVAMLEGLEPVAWSYTLRRQRVLLQDRLHRDGILRGETGWTETPLYDLTELRKEAGL